MAEGKEKGQQNKLVSFAHVFLLALIGFELLCVAAALFVAMFLSLSLPPDIKDFERSSSYTETSEEYSTTKERSFGVENKKERATAQNNRREQESSTQKHLRLENIVEPDLSAQEGMWRATNVCIPAKVISHSGSK